MREEIESIELVPGGETRIKVGEEEIVLPVACFVNRRKKKPVPGTFDPESIAWSIRAVPNDITLEDDSDFEFWPDSGVTRPNLAGAGMAWPKWRTDQLNGYGVLRGSDDPPASVKSLFGETISNPVTHFIVAKTNGANNYRFLIDGIEAGFRHCMYKPNLGVEGHERLVGFSGTDVDSGVMPTWDEWNVYAARFDGDNSGVWLNGTKLIAESMGTQQLKGVILGSYNFGGVGIDWLAEYRMHEGALSDAVIVQMIEWLQAKYGLD